MPWARRAGIGWNETSRGTGWVQRCWRSIIGSSQVELRHQRYGVTKEELSGVTLADQITPLIITFDEAPNIARVLDKLRWASRIVVVDSGSTDGTQEIVARYDQVELIHRPFDSFAAQCNFGLTQIQTKWVLSLDADYELSDELVNEIQMLKDKPNLAGYSARFTYRIHGRALRGTLYPPRTVLYRVDGAQYANEGHGHRVSVAGETGHLRAPIFHDDRKPMSRWLASQRNYARLEAAYLLSTESKALSWPDRVRRTGCFAPLLVLPYVLFAKGCVLDGRAGWFYALQRLIAETMIALELLDRRLSAGDQS